MTTLLARARLVLGLAAASFGGALTLAIAACGGGTAGVGDTSDGGAPAQDGATSTTPSTDYCGALGAYMTRCNVTDPCNQAILDECPSFETAYSQAYLQAAVSCSSTVACGDSGIPTTTSCFQQTLAASPLTAADQKLAADFCASCSFPAGASASACAADFYASDDAGKAGLGAVARYYTDDIVDQIDRTCLPVPADAGALCATTFEFCAFRIAAQHMPARPAACNDR